jgi:ferritin-like metal-binding protein YciE
VAQDDLNQRDTRLVAWLGEARAKEAELEADLTAHIGLTQKASYKKRLQDHLKETRDHKTQVERRIKQLGGSLDGKGITGVVTNPIGTAGGVAGKTVAMVKGQVGAVRAVVTEQVETHLRNAQEELREEHVEIALYSRIEAFANAVGDKDTAKLAAGIRRQEERMAKFLDAELGRLVKELVRSEVPRDQRATPKRRTSRASGSSRSAVSSSRSTSSGGRTRASGAAATSRSTSRSSGRASSGARATKSPRSGGSSAASGASASRSGGSASRSGGSPRGGRSASGSRSSGTRGRSS